MVCDEVREITVFNFDNLIPSTIKQICGFLEDTYGFPRADTWHVRYVDQGYELHCVNEVAMIVMMKFG